MREATILGAANDLQYWSTLFLLAAAMAFAIPAIFVLPSDSTNMRDYFRHVGITAAWFGGAIVLVWLLEYLFERSAKKSRNSLRKYRLA